MPAFTLSGDGAALSVTEYGAERQVVQVCAQAYIMCVNWWKAHTKK